MGRRKGLEWKIVVLVVLAGFPAFTY